jgi:hypothetical protein
MTNEGKILTFAREQVGKPYVFARSGPDSYDCSGLTLRAVAQIGYVWKHGATSQWTRGLGIKDSTCKDLPTWLGYWSTNGTIDTLPMNQLAFLFNQDKARTDKFVMAHTGIYDGNGMVIQAGGQYKGVSDMPLNRKRWSHWATLKGVDSMGYDMKTVQRQLIAMGYDLGVWGADGVKGAKTTAAIVRFQAEHGLPQTGAWTDTEQAAWAVIAPTEPEPGTGYITLTLDKTVAMALKAALDKVL